MTISSNISVLMLSISYGHAGLGKKLGYFGGTELGAERLNEWFIDSGVKMKVIASGSPDKELDIPVHDYGLWRLTWPAIALFKAIKNIKTRPDVIYSRSATYPLFVGAVMKLLWRRPLVVSVHGADMRKGGVLGYIIEHFFNYADKIVCYDNKRHKEKLEVMGFEPVVIPNGVDLDKFKVAARKTKIKKVIYLGGKRLIKGYEDVLKLADRKNIWGDNLQLHIYGEENDRKDGNVFYHKFVNHDKLSTVLEARQLFLLPSYAEGVPGSLLEAMACGMYVVASRLDFTKTVLDHEYLFAPGDVDRVEELVDSFYMCGPGVFDDQVVNNLKIVKEKYSIDIIGKKWMKLLTSMKD